MIKNITESYYNNDKNKEKPSIFSYDDKYEKFNFSFTKFNGITYFSKLFVSYNDNNKKFFEFNSDFSNYLQNNYIQKKESFINPEEIVLEISSFEIWKSDNNYDPEKKDDIFLGYIYYSIDKFPELYEFAMIILLKILLLL